MCHAIIVRMHLLFINYFLYIVYYVCEWNIASVSKPLEYCSQAKPDYACGYLSLKKC